MSIRACKSGGIDTKVHGVSVLGRVDMTDKEVAANFSFLTVDDALDDDTNNVYSRRRLDLLSTDTHGNKVFVWGLNDMRQLGTELSEAKV